MDTAMPLPKYHQIYLVLREQLQEGALRRGRRAGRACAGRAVPGGPHHHPQGDGDAGGRRAGVAPAWPGHLAPRAGRVRYRAPARGAEGAADRADGEHRQHGPAHRRARAGLRPGRRAAGGGRGAGDRAGRAGDQSLRVRSTRGRPLVLHHHLRAAGRRSLHARGPGAPALADAAGVGRRRVRRRHADHQRPVGRRAGRAASGRGRGLGPAGRDAPGARRQERPVQLLQGLYRPDRYQYQLQLSRVGGIDAKVWVSEELSAQFH